MWFGEATKVLKVSLLSVSVPLELVSTSDELLLHNLLLLSSNVGEDTKVGEGDWKADGGRRTTLFGLLTSGVGGSCVETDPIFSASMSTCEVVREVVGKEVNEALFSNGEKSDTSLRIK